MAKRPTPCRPKQPKGRAVQSFLTGSRRPASGGPRALAARGRRRSLSPPPLHRPPPTQRAAQPGRTTRPQSNPTRPTTRTRPTPTRPRHPTGPRFAAGGSHGRRHAHVAGVRIDHAQPGRESKAVTKRSSVVGVGPGLLETHVASARSAVSPSWLTFGGSGQNRAPLGQAATLVLHNSTTGGRGCDRTRIRARRSPRYHRHRGPDQGFRDRTTRDAVQAEGWSGLLLWPAWRRLSSGTRDQLRALPTS